MKYFVVFAVVLVSTQAKVIPDKLANLLCRKSDPDYTKCLWSNIEKNSQIFIKGLPELGLPSLDPLELPLVTVDRTINDLVSINAVLRNVRLVGGSSTIIDDIKADPVKHYGEIRFNVPLLQLDMDYDVNGQLLAIPLRSKGHFSGNFTNTQFFIKGSLKVYDKEGVKYFRVDKVSMKGQVGDGRVQLTADNPELQFAADLINNFFNEDPRRVLDALNPIFAESGEELIRVVSDEILARAPAKEWLPDRK